METYHFNPKSGNLLVYNNEEKKVQVLEPVSVKVFTGKEILVAPRVERKEKVRKPSKNRIAGRKEKLTPEQIQEIRDRIEEESARSIAEDMGVSVAVIYKYTRNK